MSTLIGVVEPLEDLEPEFVKIHARSMRESEIGAVVLQAVAALQQPWSPKRYTVVKLYGDVDWPNFSERYRFLQEIYRQLDLLADTGVVNQEETFHLVEVDPFVANHKAEQAYVQMTRHRVKLRP